MPSLTYIDLQLQAKNTNVPILRQAKMTALINNFIAPQIKKQGDIKDNLLAGVVYSAWLNNVNYALGDRVTVVRNSYECIVPNINNYVTDPNYWYQVNDDNIGITEKLNYNCGLLQLEYVLNNRFNTITSILPPYNNTVGNIYITTNPVYPKIAWIGRNNSLSSYIKSKNSTKFFYHTDAFTSLPLPNYYIHVPNLILTLIGASTLNGQQVIRNEVDKYNAVGLTYDVVHY